MIELEQEHMLRELKSDMKNHMVDIAVELREAEKESDRDNWEQRNSLCQTLLVGASIMLAASCSVIVEGLANLDRDEGLGADPQFQVVFAVVLSLAFGSLFLCIILAIMATSRMSKFMQKRADTQRLNILKNTVSSYLAALQFFLQWRELTSFHYVWAVCCSHLDLRQVFAKHDNLMSTYKAVKFQSLMGKNHRHMAEGGKQHFGICV